MCAISGVLALPGVAQAQPPATLRAELIQAAQRMNKVLAHRGPDDESVHSEPWLALGHRRLSIIDLAGGRQPIFNENQSAMVIFNGEIYNYKALRSRLCALGHVFKTNSDTETIVHAYEEWGAECFSRIRGMFAVAIYDKTRQELLLARDPMGEKPLYYHYGNLIEYSDLRVLSFASEAKGLFELPWINRTPDPVGIADYLRYRYIAAPRTAFQEIYKLPAGSLLKISTASNKLPEPVRYWDVSYRPKINGNQIQLIRLIENSLEEAVSSQLCSDVPLGALLSGGLDSTLVVALMRRRLASVDTFCAGFSDSVFDERPTAALAARSLATQHREICQASTALSSLPRIIWHLDEPIGDPSLIPMYTVSELAAQHVRVVLTGDGGDESFAGYDRYRRSRLSDLLRTLPSRPVALLGGALRRLAKFYPQWLPPSSLPHIINRIAQSGQAAAQPLGLNYQQSMSAFSSIEVRNMLSPELSNQACPALDSDRIAELFDSADAEHYLDKFLYSDLRSYLADDLMAKSDRMSMAHSLEARAPLLDIHIVETAALLPVRFKQRPGKQILRAMGRRVLPKDLHTPILAGRKRGFTPPLQRWLTINSDEVNSILREPTLVTTGLLRRNAVSAELSRSGPNAADRKFLLLMLELWHRTVVLQERIDWPARSLNAGIAA